MSFSTNSGFVYYSANEPGSYATMFGPNGVLQFRNDASYFNDDAKRYIWAFEYKGQCSDGKRFVFATGDKTVVGMMLGSKIVIVDHDVVVVRDTDGRPLRLQGSQYRKLARLSPLSFEIRPEVIDNPTVSIITVTYNRAQMLKECVNSMRAQTCDSWEHLICDDGSDDELALELLDWITTDPRVRVYRRPHVDQPSRYWNELLDRVHGKYIGFLDDDNTKLPYFIDTMSIALDSDSKIDVVTCGWTVFDMDNSPNDCHLNMDTTTETIERTNTIDTGAFLIRREAMERIGYFPLNIRTNEDWAMMRRAVMHLKMAHLPDTLATYRAHAGQRMERREQLGNEKDKATVQGSIWGAVYGVRVFHAPLERLTMSQRDVVKGAQAGIAEIPWVEDGPDLAVILMPFQMDIAEVEAIASRSQSVVMMHSEDPFALHANIERVRAATRFCDDTWVCSNDTVCMEEYRQAVGKRLIVCSSLSIDHRAVIEQSKIKHDVILVGYAYPGRVRFIKELLRHFDGARLKIFGDGWHETGFDASPTASFLDTAALYGKTRAVICVHRGHGDCVDGPFEPKLVQRGYVEGMGGARVFIDSSRPDHPFEDNEAEWFDGAQDLAKKLTDFLKLSDTEQAKLSAPLRDRALRDFTYRARMARVINAVRSTRYEAMIP